MKDNKTKTEKEFKVKDLNYYMGVSYPITIRKVDNGYESSIKILGDKAFRAWGETVKESVTELELIKLRLFKSYLSRNIHIPEPK